MEGTNLSDEHTHPHPHEDADTHPHPHEHAHDHTHPEGRLRKLLHSHHHHDHQDETTRSGAGLRAVLISLGVLALTAVVQVVLFATTGSVALLADLIHNAGDARPSRSGSRL